MTWQHAVYPGVLLVSLVCLALIDYKWQLAFYGRQPRRAAGVLLLGIIFFTLWDIAGIRAGIFFSSSTTFRSGLMLGRSFPVEELLFLTLLNYSVLLAWTFRSRPR